MMRAMKRNSVISLTDESGVCREFLRKTNHDRGGVGPLTTVEGNR